MVLEPERRGLSEKTRGWEGGKLDLEQAIV